MTLSPHENNNYLAVLGRPAAIKLEGNLKYTKEQKKRLLSVAINHLMNQLKLDALTNEQYISSMLICKWIIRAVPGLAGWKQ